MRARAAQQDAIFCRILALTAALGISQVRFAQLAALGTSPWRPLCAQLHLGQLSQSFCARFHGRCSWHICVSSADISALLCKCLLWHLSLRLWDGGVWLWQTRRPTRIIQTVTAHLRRWSGGERGLVPSLIRLGIVSSHNLNRQRSPVATLHHRC